MIIIISCCIDSPYNPGTNHVKICHINSEIGTKYRSEMTPIELVSENPSMTIKVKVIKMAIIVTANMKANSNA